MSLGFRINDKIDIIDKSLIEELYKYQVSNLGDCMNRNACIPASRLKPINDVKMAGRAYTVKVSDGDNLMIYYAIDNASPGDIIVIDGNGNLDRALIGEILVSFAMQRKVGGFVVNGAIRDFDKLKTLDFPIYYKGVSANGPYKNGPAEVNYPISIHGLVINPGDIIVADEDGIISVNKDDALELIENVKKVVEKENKFLEDISKDEFNIDFVYKTLKEKGVK